MTMRLPLLDIRLFYTNPVQFVEELRAACHTVGFFLLKFDFDVSLAQRQLEEARQFFHQPLEKKLEISYEHSPAFRGYMKLGVENTAGKMDVREQVEYATETTSDARWPYYQRLKGPNPWPSFQPTLKSTTLEYVPHVCRIANQLRQAMCLALEQEEGALDPLFERDPHWVLKLVSYPPSSRSSDDTFGVGAHTDTNFLTLVLQDDIGGLQVYSQQEWIDVPCDTSDVLVCNLGEQAEIWSRGYFLATPHRVLTSCKERISVPLFYNPMLEATITPVEAIESLPWERPDDYQHWKQRNNVMLETVGENTFKSLARSHPHVFRKHHPDLELLDDGRIVPKDSTDQE